MSNSLTFVELDRVDHELLPDWLDLFEVSFPPEEKVLVSRFLKLLKDKAVGENQDSHMLAALDENNQIAGIMRFDNDPGTRISYFWYLAVRSNTRSRGIGSACFAEVLRCATEAGMRALIFEVEIPEEQSDPAHREYAQGRIGFYRKQGAQLLGGIHYVQTVAPHQPEIPMHIMVRPIEPVTPSEALDTARTLFEGSVTQVGELTLE